MKSLRYPSATPDSKDHEPPTELWCHHPRILRDLTISRLEQNQEDTGWGDSLLHSLGIHTPQSSSYLSLYYLSFIICTWSVFHYLYLHASDAIIRLSFLHWKVSPKSIKMLTKLGKIFSHFPYSPKSCWTCYKCNTWIPYPPPLFLILLWKTTVSIETVWFREKTMSVFIQYKSRVTLTSYTKANVINLSEEWFSDSSILLQ